MLFHTRVAAIDPWDDTLEALTAALVAMSERGQPGPAAAGERSGWRVELRANRRQVQVDFLHDTPPPLDDYRAVILYGLSYHAPEDGRDPAYRKVMSVHEGYRWTEEMLRETALEALGLLRHVFGLQQMHVLALPQERRGLRTRLHRR